MQHASWYTLKEQIYQVISWRVYRHTGWLDYLILSIKPWSKIDLVLKMKKIYKEKKPYWKTSETQLYPNKHFNSLPPIRKVWLPPVCSLTVSVNLSHLLVFGVIPPVVWMLVQEKTLEILSLLFLQKKIKKCMNIKLVFTCVS